MASLLADQKLKQKLKQDATNQEKSADLKRKQEPEQDSNKNSN